MMLKQKFQNFISDPRFSEILSGSIYALSSRVVASVLALISSIIIARYYGAEIMGVLAIINSFLLLAVLFTVLGTSTSILRLIPEHVSKYSMISAFAVYRKTQYFVVVLSLIFGCVLFFASDAIATKVFAKPNLSFYFALAACVIVFRSLMELNNQAVRGLKLIRTFAFMQVVPSASMLVILLVTTFLFYNINNPVYSQLAAWCIVAVLGVFIMHQAFKKRMPLVGACHQMPLKEIVVISFPMLMTSSMLFINTQAGILLLGVYRSSSEVGYFSVAVMMAALTGYLLQAVNTIVAPKFSELLHSGEIDEVFYVAKKSAKLTFWITVPILVILIFFGEFVLSSFYGDQFTVAYMAMAFLIIGQLIGIVSGSTGTFMNMMGHQNLLGKVTFISAIINVFLNIILIPDFGIYGAAFASVISLSIWNIFCVFFIKKEYGKTIGYIPFFYNKKSI